MAQSINGLVTELIIVTEEYEVSNGLDGPKDIPCIMYISVCVV